jgi:non-homologous end joining protein Ku
MVEYLIRHSPSLRGFENLSFQLDLVKITKATKNKSYPNVSNCCGALLSQHKYCSNCGTQVIDLKELKNKQFKLGKQGYPIPAAHFEAIRKQLDDNNLIVQEYRDAGEVDPIYFTDNVFSSKQHKKAKKEYNEYRELLASTNKVAIGTMVYKSRPYPFMAYHYKDHVCFRLLHFAIEIDDMPELEPTPINKEKVKLLQRIMELNYPEKDFKIEKFKNQREEKEMELIELVIDGKELPKIESVEIAKVDETDEIERLKALLKE